jgi:hypothetical protein
MADCIDNINYLTPNRYQLIVDNQWLRHYKFFARSASIPSISLGETRQSFRKLDARLPGDKLQYDTAFTVELFVDEDLKVLTEIYNWIDNTLTTKHTPPAMLAVNEMPTYTDVKLVMLNNNNVGVGTYTFEDCFPATIGEISLNPTESQQPVTVPVTFYYTRYTMG